LAVALLLAGLLSAAVFYVAFGLAHRDRVTMSHLGRLKLGMQESEVRRILGQEPTVIPSSDEARWKQVDPSARGPFRHAENPLYERWDSRSVLFLERCLTGSSSSSESSVGGERIAYAG
jgi:hypothetical protein